MLSLAAAYSNLCQSLSSQSLFSVLVSCVSALSTSKGPCCNRLLLMTAYPVGSFRCSTVNEPVAYIIQLSVSYHACVACWFVGLVRCRANVTSTYRSMDVQFLPVLCLLSCTCQGLPPCDGMKSVCACPGTSGQISQQVCWCGLSSKCSHTCMCMAKCLLHVLHSMCMELNTYEMHTPSHGLLCVTCWLGYLLMGCNHLFPVYHKSLEDGHHLDSLLEEAATVAIGAWEALRRIKRGCKYTLLQSERNFT